MQENCYQQRWKHNKLVSPLEEKHTAGLQTPDLRVCDPRVRHFIILTWKGLKRGRGLSMNAECVAGQ